MNSTTNSFFYNTEMSFGTMRNNGFKLLDDLSADSAFERATTWSSRWSLVLK